MSESGDQSRFKYLVQIGPGFWAVRAPFEMFKINICTHMAFAEVSDGSFVAFSAVNLALEGLKAEIDMLTSNGAKISAVLGTHPFHTMFFPGFHDAYPATADRHYYGTPRHLRQFPEISWTAPITCAFNRWPELEMLIPEGGEFDDPQPERTNHLINVFVFHKPSKTVFNDDCLLYVQRENLPCLLRILSRFTRLLKPGLRFHPSLTGPGLYHAKEAPLMFQRSMERLLDWDFENLCTAHNGNCLGRAKEELRELLRESAGMLQKMSKDYAAGKFPETLPEWSDHKSGACG